MNSINRFKALALFLVVATLLAACGGTPSQTSTSLKGPKVDANVVAFTGIVEAMNETEWTVSGQKITLDPQASLDPNIRVGDEVKVEGTVLADGVVVAMKVESSAQADFVSAPPAAAEASSTPDPSGAPSPDASETPDASASPDAPQAADDEDEVFGIVEVITADTITVDGVTYNLADFTEFKDALTVGDQVKLHLIVNADGTVTVREVEKSAAPFDDSSGSSGGLDDGPDHDADDDDSNGNSSDDGPDHDSDDDGGNSGSGNSGDSDDD